MSSRTFFIFETYIYKIKKLLIPLLTFITIGCSSEIIENSLSPKLEYYSVSVTSSDGGIVNTSGGYYKAGDSNKNNSHSRSRVCFFRMDGDQFK